MIRKHFRLKKIALGLAFAALVVAPTAQARVALVDGHAAPISYTAVEHQRIASEISVQSGVPQLQVEGLRWQAMAKAYENSPGITAAGAALSNAKQTSPRRPEASEGSLWQPSSDPSTQPALLWA